MSDGGAEYAWIVTCPHDERIVVEDDLEAAVLDGQGVYDVTIAGWPDAQPVAADGGESPLEELLQDVDGIGAGTAETIAEEFDSREELREVVTDLPPGYSPARLSGLDGFGPSRARTIADAIDESGVLEDEEPELMTDGGERIGTQTRLDVDERRDLLEEVEGLGVHDRVRLSYESARSGNDKTIEGRVKRAGEDPAAVVRTDDVSGDVHVVVRNIEAPHWAGIVLDATKPNTSSFTKNRLGELLDVEVPEKDAPEVAADGGEEAEAVSGGGAAEPHPVDRKGFGLIEALEESTAHDDLEAYVRHARQVDGTGLLNTLHTFHKGGEDDIDAWRDGDYMTRKERILWDEGAEVALEEIGNWDTTNKPILEKIADGDRGFVEPEHPAPEVHGFDVAMDEAGDTTGVSVALTYWEQDHERTVDVDFRVDDHGVAELKAQDDVGGMLYLPVDLVPLIAAGIALEDQNFPGIERVRGLSEYIDGARAEAQRIDLGDRDD